MFDKLICITSMGSAESILPEGISNDVNDLHPQRLWQVVIDINIRHFAAGALLTLRKQIGDPHNHPSIATEHP